MAGAPHPISVCMLRDSLLFQPFAKPKSHSLMRAGRLPSRSVLSSFKSLPAEGRHQSAPHP